MKRRLGTWPPSWDLDQHLNRHPQALQNQSPKFGLPPQLQLSRAPFSLRVPEAGFGWRAKGVIILVPNDAQG
jgi:hypothetical protein